MSYDLKGKGKVHIRKVDWFLVLGTGVFFFWEEGHRFDKM